jgi:hypothetical protein
MLSSWCLDSKEACLHVSSSGPEPEQSSSSPPQVSTTISPISPLHAGPNFEGVLQRHFFGTYLEMAAQVRGPFSSSLWERSIPQSSHAESYIQHAMIAVSAMNKALRNMRAGGEGIRSLLCENPNYIYALKEYDKALRYMREAINKIEGEMKNALFACFLLFCFENMSGKPGAAAPNE